MSNRSPKPIGVLGLGISVPDRVLTNADLEKMVDTTDDWIWSRSGIRERRILADDQQPSDLAVEACTRAMADANVDPKDIDAVLYCSYTGNFIMPPGGAYLHGLLGLKNDCLSFDLNAACSGFVKGLQTGWSIAFSGLAKRVLVVGIDCNSRIIDYTDRTTCVLFGDGAGAVVLGEVPEGRGILGHSAGTDGSGAMLIQSKGGAGAYPFSQKELPREDRFMSMNGREVYKFAVRVVAESVETALVDANLTPADLDLLVPHQANIRIIESALERLKFPPERCVMNMQWYGNTSAASIPLALDTARQDGRLKPGTTCGLVAFGAGLTYASTILRW